MAIFVIGGTGFIGIRVIPLLVARGETVVCMDINPNAPSLAGLGDKVSVVRGDVTQFDDVISVMEASKADRVINLSYNLGQDLPPHRATKLNIVGMDNCFEAARILGVKHTVFASSLAVNGQQSHYGERPVTEDDYKHAVVQYGSHKAFNEFQAKDYIDKHGMTITAIRPANVTGPDKVRGSVDHVNIITRPARGEPITLPFADAMRCPIHVDDIAEVFVRVLMTDKPAARNLQFRRPGDFAGGNRRNRARLSAGCEDQLRQADRRAGDVGQLDDRQYPSGAGVRGAIPPLSVSVCCRSSTTAGRRSGRRRSVA